MDMENIDIREMEVGEAREFMIKEVKKIIDRYDGELFEREIAKSIIQHMISFLDFKFSSSWKRNEQEAYVYLISNRNNWMDDMAIVGKVRGKLSIVLTDKVKVDTNHEI